MYCTLNDVKLEQKITNTDDDNTLLMLIRQVSRQVDRMFRSQHPYFLPRIATRKFPMNGHTIDSLNRIFYFRENLLSITSVTAGTTGLTENTHYEKFPPGDSPWRSLRVANNNDNWWTYATSDDLITYITIVGTWGYHRDYTSAWQDVDVLNGAVDNATTTTTITVDDIDGADDYGVTPGISAGNILKIDSEYMEVTATNTTTNVATVRRAVLGSTIASHLDDATVSVWLVEETIRRGVALQAAKNFARRGAYQSAEITDVGTIQFPQGFMTELAMILQELAYE